MKETNLTPSPRLKGRCCPTDFLYSKVTLLLMIFMLPLVGMAQEKLSPATSQDKEAEYQTYLQKINGNKAGDLQQAVEKQAQTIKLSEIEKEQMLAEQEYQQLLKEYGINEQKYLNHGFTKADILAEINQLQNQAPSSNPKGSNGVTLARSGGGDYCADAVVLECGVPSNGDTFAAYSGGVPNCGGAPTDGTGMWYKFNGNGGINNFSITANSTPHQIRIYTSGDGTCNALQCAIAIGQGSSAVVNYYAPFGDTIYVFVSAFAGNAGTYTILRTSTSECFDTPPGDGLTPATGFELSCGDIYSGDSTGFPSSSVGGTCGPTNNSSPAVWHQFTASAGTPEDITLTTCGYDTRLNVFQDDGSGNLICVGGNDDATTTFCTTNIWESQYSFTADIDVTYYVKIWGYSSSTSPGPYQIQMICDGDAVTPPPAAPANDTCEDATQLDCGDILNDQTTIAANLEVSTNCVGSIGADVFYKIDGTGDLLTLVVDPDTSELAQVEVYESFGSCGDFALGSCFESVGSGNPATLAFATEVDVTYYIRVGNYISSGDPFDFTITVDCPQPIENDNCDGAIDALCGNSYDGNMVTATQSIAPNCISSSWGPGVWYHHVGTGEVLTVDTNGSDFDTKLFAYTGDCGNLVCFDYDDDGGDGLDSLLEFTTVAGEDYYFHVTAYSTTTNLNSGQFYLNLECQPDPCTNATDIACGETATGTTVGASTIGPDSFCGTSAGTYGVFYRYVGTDEFVSASLCNSSYDTKIQVFQGECDALTCVGGNDDSCGTRSEYQFFAAAGETFYIWVTGYTTSAGNYELTLTCDQPVANDLCEDAIALSCDSTISGSTDLATKRDVPGESCDGNSPERGVWYTITGTGGDIVASTCTGTDFDTQLMIYTGICGDLTCLVSNDDACGTRSEVTFATTAGETYYIYVSGYGTTVGNYTLSVDCLCAPASGAVECVTIYDGYDPASSTTLTGNINYAEGSVSYLWSNGDTNQTTTVYASDGTQNYTVTMTDADGCSVSEEFFVYVMDINCDTRGTDKVLVCHGGTTICVAPTAVEAHLQHGDVLGTCGNLLCDEITPFCDSVVTSPTNGEVDVNFVNTTISWSAATGIVDGYYLSVGTTSGGTDVLDNVDVGAVTSYTFESDLAFLTTFYVNVSPYNGNGTATLGCTESSFTTQNDPFPNDDCAGAVDLTVNGPGDCTVTYSNDNSINSDSADSFFSCDGTSGNIDSWYTFTAPAGGTVVLTITNGSQSGTPEHQLFSNGCGSSSIECSSGSTNVYEGLTPGVSYTLAIWWDDFNTEGTFTVCLSQPAPPPANNDCAGAIALPVNENSCVFETHTNESATDSGIGSPGCAFYSGGDVWFSVVVPDNGTITVDMTQGVVTDSGMALYSGACGSLSLIECDDDDSPNGLMSSITRSDLTPGDTVYIRVWEYGGNNNGTFGICVSTPPPPPPATCDNMTLTLNTGGFGYEVSWSITNGGGIVASGSGYNSYTNYDDIYVNLQDGNYTFNMYDSYGDGWNGGTYSLRDGYGNIVSSGGLGSGSFGSNAFTVDCANAQPPSCNDMTINTDTGGFGYEVSWTLTGPGINISSPYFGSSYSSYSQTATLPDGNYTMNMYDSYGDGWNGGTFSIVDGNGGTVASGGLGSGSFGTINFTVSCGSARLANNTNTVPVDWSMAPNPTKGNVTLDLTNYLQSDVSIEVMNVAGKVIFNTSVQNLQGSRYEVELNNSLPAGMYFVRVAAQGQVSTKKLMIMR